jgi:hypothetical protein
LQIEDLSGLSGLTEIQVQSLEEGVNKENCFVDDAHAIDCAKRVADSLGLSQNYFLNLEVNLKKDYEHKFNRDKLGYSENALNYRTLFNQVNPIINLNVLSGIDFSLINRNTKSLSGNELKFFFGVFSNSPSLMAPIVIAVMAIFCFVINFI